jgi:hypothetical protein
MAVIIPPMLLAPVPFPLSSSPVEVFVQPLADSEFHASPARTWCKRADRPLRSATTALGIWGAARLLGVAVPWGLIRQTDGVRLLAWEVQRLRTLAAAGEVVPEVVSCNDQELVTRDLGPTLAHVLSSLDTRTDPAICLPWLCAVSADLAGFHARGHWHGGSQIRNITWNGTQFGRIDFEEPLHPALPLATVQAYDVLQLLLSMVRWLQPLGRCAVDDVLNHYGQAAPAQAEVLRGQLRAWLPRLRGLQKVLGWRPRWRRSREYQRLAVVVEALTLFAHENTSKNSI